MSRFNHFGLDLKALAKFVLSFLKRTWELADYPVVIREQDPQTNSPLGLLPRFVATIWRWPGPTGVGDTEGEAIACLRTVLDTIRQDRALPRPGTRVPIQFGSTTLVDDYRDIEEVFIKSILDVDWALITDNSSLYDFSLDNSIDGYLKKIKETYGVDVSEVKSGNLGEIFQLIAERRR